ncbi:MAG: hypothetical protein ACFE9S_07455 [Candidatus Hermodarchaeota archaeon]
MTKNDFQRIIEDILFEFWEDHIAPYPLYTDWFFSEGGVKDQLNKILEIKK